MRKRRARAATGFSQSIHADVGRLRTGRPAEPGGVDPSKTCNICFIHVPSFSNGSLGASFSGTYTMPCTLKETSFVLEDQFSLLKQ